MKTAPCTSVLTVAARKGNALILVSAMLVLLTLLAAAYLSRTRTQRLNAAALQDRFAMGRNSETISKQLANEIAMHLFVKPIDPNSARRVLGGDSAGNRLPPSPESVRYGVESAAPRSDGAPAVGDLILNQYTPDVLSNREPGDPRSTVFKSDGWPDGFNFAPYEVKAWTNWPDFTSPTDLTNISSGTPWVSSGMQTNDTPSIGVYANPPGNPGFGDTRWLRSTEPIRARDRGTPSARVFVPVPDGAFFSHWAHLSYLPTPSNGYRLVTDIADIEGSLWAGPMNSARDGFGTPYEQWLPHIPPTPIPVVKTKPTDKDDAWVTEFKSRRDRWFNPEKYKEEVLTRIAVNSGNSIPPNQILPNFIRLDDPLGIGRTHAFDAALVPVSDEYIDGTPRNIVARTFCDTDGDGFTDSFWFLAPVGKERNVRTVVGVSIIDNASMIDVNVATRADRRTTAGFTPSDIALVTAEPEHAQLVDRDSERSTAPTGLTGNWPTDTRVGLLDSFWNFSLGNITLDDPYSKPDQGSSAGMPAGFKKTGTASLDFGIAFDSYRYAGLPTVDDPTVSTQKHKPGESDLLQSLGLWVTDTSGAKLNEYWNPYFYQLPEQSLGMRGFIDKFGSMPVDKNPRSFTPWLDYFGPAGPSRPQQFEPMVRLTGKYTELSDNWNSWFACLWGNGRFRDVSNAVNQPFMRPEERTRWFQTAMQGEIRLFGPHVFAAATLKASDIYLSNANGRNIDGIKMPVQLFDATDELELRAFSGNNDSSVLSRLERALNGDNETRLVGGSGGYKNMDTILRSTILRSEGGVSGNTVTNAQLVRDLRRKMTTVSGQRNEIMPPWLWIGRPYMSAWSNFDPGADATVTNTFDSSDTFVQNQNASLWIGLHPEPPGPRDENNDGRVDARELQWGVYDLRRIACTSDIYKDGVPTVFSSTSPVLNERDLKRGVGLFEYLNRKLDLRKPLVVQDRKNVLGHLMDRVDDEGLPILRYANSVPEERRATIEFAREARQRLRPALRNYSPHRQLLNWANVNNDSDIPPDKLPTLEQFGSGGMQFASYTDRFVDQLRFGLQQPTVEMMNSPVAGTGVDAWAWRSAWSTEALTASMAANIATWRSRPTLMREFAPAVGDIPSVDLTKWTWFGLRPVWQPILPNHYSVADSKRDGVGFGLTFLRQATDFGDFATNAATDWREKSLKEPAAAQALCAVDPSKNPNSIPNNNSPQPGTGITLPDQNTADIVFPGIEKHPFLLECFFGWSYPATTLDVAGDIKVARSGVQGNTRKFLLTAQTENGKVTSGPPSYPWVSAYSTLIDQMEWFQRIPKTASQLPSSNGLPGSKLVAVVNGRVGQVALPGEARGVPSPANIDIKRDQLDEIRTPIIVIQVANPWNEPLRLGDFRLEIFGTSYDFPDFEQDANGDYVYDENGIPVPLYLNPGTETAPATATVYLIANVVGNPEGKSNGGTTYAADIDVTTGGILPGSLVSATIVNNQADLAAVAQWDPWFRRRWLDYFDLYELSDGGVIDWPTTTTTVPPANIATSPTANPLFWSSKIQRTQSQTKPGNLLPGSKLLNAMAIDPADRDQTVSATITASDQCSRMWKRRVVDLRAFRETLTADNLKRGISLHRVLRDPSAQNARQALLRKSQIDFLDATKIFTLRADKPASYGGIPWDETTASGEYLQLEQTMEVDRFDADSSFDHESVVTSVSNPSANRDCNLVTSGRFWSACARISLPPKTDRDPLNPAAVKRDLYQLVGASPAPPILPDPLVDSFNEPGSDLSLFPPPTAKWLLGYVDSLDLVGQVPPTSDHRLQHLTPSMKDDLHLKERLSGNIFPTVIPGIMLGRSDGVVSGVNRLQDSKDYFVTWTRVARSWSKLFHAEFATVNVSAMTPAIAPNPWQWVRQLVVDPATTGNQFSFYSFAPALATATTGFIPPDQRAPRFVFASRSEPDITSNPRRPSRFELMDVVSGTEAKPYPTSRSMNTRSAAATKKNPRPTDRAIEEGKILIDQNSSEYLYGTALGDTFSLGKLVVPTPPVLGTPLLYDIVDPDLWNPVPTGTAATRWLASQWMDSLSTNGWLLSPVLAPLPDFRFLNAETIEGVAGAANIPVALNSWPELVLRKPTAFNCETVLWPQPAPVNPMLSYAYYGDATSPIVGIFATNTQFVLPTWASPNISVDGSWEEYSPIAPKDPATRIYLADKSARLIDGAGKLLSIPIDLYPNLVTNSPPTTSWTKLGVWNTLDRIPHNGSLQMLQKDDDFEQLGELTDVFLWGPAYRVGKAQLSLKSDYPGEWISGKLLPTVVRTLNGVKLASHGCRATFAEIMTGRTPGFPVGEGPMINRLQVDPPNFAFKSVTASNGQTTSTAWQFGGTTALRTPYAPNVPWGERVFDCFTMDGSGAALRYDWADLDAGLNQSVFSIKTDLAKTEIGSNSQDTRQDTNANRPIGSLIPTDAYLVPGIASDSTNKSGEVVTRTSLAQWERDRSPWLSGGFKGIGVKGLLNINTATTEALRCLPQMAQLVYDDAGRTEAGSGSSLFLLDTPVAGPSVRGRHYTFNTRQTGSPPGKFLSENPLVLVTDAIDMYRNNFDSSHMFTLQAVNEWLPNPDHPLEVMTGQFPMFPTYKDRGNPYRLGAVQSAAVSIASGRSMIGANGQLIALTLNRGMRSENGFSTIGEIVGLSRSARIDPSTISADFPSLQFDNSWNIRFAGMNPYESGALAATTDDGLGQGWYTQWTSALGGNSKSVREPLDARLSTDRQGVRTFDFKVDTVPPTKDQLPMPFAWNINPDSTYGDSEEQNMLFKGISNLITTRSDVFTVYFKVRTVKQDPTTGKWIGTDPDSIIEDARFVMCVDRTNVNRPTDQPRIVYFSRMSE